MVVLALCLSGLAAVSLQIRCIDAAREAARLAARADRTAAIAAGRLAPAGASVQIRGDGGYVVARVAGRSPVLPGVVIAAEAVAALEPAV